MTEQEIKERGFETSIYDAAARELLGDQIILMKQVHYDGKQNPIFYSLDYFRTDIITLKIRRERKEE